MTGARLLPAIADLPPAMPGAGPAVRYTCVLAMPRCRVLWENPLSFPRPSRGTPRPAESRRNTNEFRSAIVEVTGGFVLTSIRVGRPRCGGCTGGCGRILNPGLFPAGTLPSTPVLDGILFRPFHMPPGIHPHPLPGQNDHEP